MKKRILALVLTILLLASVIPAASAAESHKLVALTFDDGPGPYTQRLLDGLAEYDAKVTFFCLGSRAERYPDLLRQMVKAGHQVANHSYDHPNLNELSLDSAVYQVERTDAIIGDILGREEHCYFRPPYGNSTEALRSRLQNPLFIWSVDTIDWQLRNGEKVKNKLLSEVFDGAVVLMHDIHSTTVDGILSAMETLQSRGYEFVTVKELYRRRGVTPRAGQLHYSCKPTGSELGPLEPPLLQTTRMGDEITLELRSPAGAPIYYSLDGSDLTCKDYQVYEGPLTVRLPIHLRAIAAWDLNGDRSRETELEITLPPAGEPKVFTENGKIRFETTHPDEEVYVVLGKKDSQAEAAVWNGKKIPGNIWITYYAGGKGLAPTKPRTLYYSKNGNLFSDLQPEQWYCGAMDHAVTRGYLKGTGGFAVDPQGRVTRGMFLTVLHRHAGLPAASEGQPFLDVAPESYYAEAVAWGRDQGIASGVGEGVFQPDRPITRQELAKMLAGYLELTRSEHTPQAEYTDGNQIADWAREAVDLLAEAGIMEGSGGSFRPHGTATRAELAAILQRLDQRSS